MEIDKKLFVIAGIVTVLLFILIYSLNIFLSSEREKVLSEKMGEVIDEYEEMQTLSLMAGVFGQEAACLSLQGMMSEMDKSLWDLGTKIDQYRRVTSEYLSDPFYIEQKKQFNRREAIYYTLMKDTKEKCSFDTPTILFFYRKADECKDCDAMSFVLTDLKMTANEEIAIFSFDHNLNLPSVEILEKYYNVSSYPCMVIDEDTYCGLYDKKELMEIVCKETSYSKCD